MSRTFLLMGPPGAGKGEQATRIAAATGAVHVAMGALIRHYCDEPSEHPLCQVIERNFQAGIPQSDEITFAILQDFLQTADTSHGVIFDAFPLSIGEVPYLNQVIEQYHLENPVVIYIDVDEETSVQRIGARHMLVPRPDDAADVVRARYAEYARRIPQLLEYYKEQGYPIISIHSGNATADADFEIIKEKLAEMGMGL